MADIKRTETIELDEEAIKQAIRSWLSSQYDHPLIPFEISVRVEHIVSGIGHSEMDSHRVIIAAKRELGKETK